MSNADTPPADGAAAAAAAAADDHGDGAIPPIGDLFSALLAANPLAGAAKTFDQFRKGVGDFIGAVESFHTTMKTLGEVAGRVQSLLDEVEGPIRELAPHLTRAAGAAEQVPELVTLLRDVSQRLAPLGQLAQAAGGMLAMKGLSGLSGLLPTEPENDA